MQFFVQTLLLTIALTISPTATRAQDWSCADADNLPQQGMNYCAYKDYEKADAELNATWKRVFPQLKAYDADLDEIHKGLPQAVLQAQRAWIKYRDAHCEAEGFKVRGGTLEPLIVSSCLAHLTRTRTKQIADLLQDGL